MKQQTDALPDDWHEALRDRIWLGESDADLRREIAENCWKLGLSEDERHAVSIETIESWLEALMANRRSQVELLAPSRGATFYLWFGFQDQALCFNVISDADRSLPFGCTTRPVASPGNIIAAFLADPWSDDPALTPYILKSEVEWAAVETDPKAYLLDVFVVRFRSDGTTRSDTEEQHGQNHP